MGWIDEYEAQQGATATQDPQQPAPSSLIAEYEAKRKRPSLIDEYESHQKAVSNRAGYTTPAPDAIQLAATPRAETTPVPPEQAADFQGWLQRNQVQDLDHPDSHYDYRGAYMAGVERGPEGHFPDTFKQHGHPTFSVESQYAKGPGDAGHWDGDTFVPPPPKPQNPFLRDRGDVTAIPPPIQGLAAGAVKTAIEGIPSIPLELGKAVFGSPSAEEAANPLMRAGRLARYGQVPPMEPAPAGTPNPAERAAQIPIGIVKAVPGQIQTVLHDPDWEHKGEAGAGLAMDAAMVYGGVRGALDYARGRPAGAPPADDLAAAIEAKRSDAFPAHPAVEPPPDVVTTGEGQRMLERAVARGREADAIAPTKAPEALPAPPAPAPAGPPATTADLKAEWEALAAKGRARTGPENRRLAQLNDELDARDGAPQAAAAPIAEVSEGPAEPAYTTSHLIGKTSDELDQIRREVQESERTSTQRALGPDAERYDRAYRTVNSSNADPNSPRYKKAQATVDEIEGKLTPEQERLLYGERRPGVLNAEDIRDVANGVSRHTAPDQIAGEPDGSLYRSLGRIIGGENPHGPAVDVAIGNLVTELRRRGVPFEEVNRGVGDQLVRRGLSGEDAAKLIESRVATIPALDDPNAPVAPRALPAPVDEEAPVVDVKGPKRPATKEEKAAKAQQREANRATRYEQTPTQELLDRHHELLERVARSPQGNGWARYDDDIGMTRAGGNNRNARREDDNRMVDGIQAELRKRGVTEDDLTASFYEWSDRQEREAIQREQDAAGDFDPATFASEGIPQGKDLFGEERKAPAPEQSALFDEYAGTEATRSTAQQMRALTAEHEKLSQLIKGRLKDSPSANARLAELDRLINRDKKISPGEMATRRRAELTASEGIPQGRRASRPLQEDEEPVSEPEPQTGPPPAVIPPATAADALRRVFGPGSRSPEAGKMEAIVRARRGEMDRRQAVAHEQLKAFRRQMPDLPTPKALAFTDAIESGTAQLDAKLAPAARAVRTLLDEARNRVRALGTGKLEQFYTTYFPHMWADEEQAGGIIGRIMGRRPLEGSKSFLKKRSIPTIRAGIEAGLKPITENPLDMVLLKLHEMDRYTMGQLVLQDAKAANLTHYVGALDAAGRELARDRGYVPLDDRVAMVYGPPEVGVMESYDPMLRTGLEQVIADLGDTHTRSTTSPRRPRLGEYGRLEGVKTRFGTDVTVLEHELGHLVDEKLGLWDRLVEPPGQEVHTVTRGERKGQTVKRTVQQEKAVVEHRKAIQKELRALADLRFEGHEEQVTPHYKDYVRNQEEKIANAIHALIYAPERMAEVAPTVKAKLTEILRSDERTAPLLTLKKSLVSGTAEGKVPVGGLVIKGQFWAAEPVARVLNNYLAPGLRGNPLYKGYMAVGNTVNQVSLSLSAFHATTTAINGGISDAALAFQEALSGHPIRAIPPAVRSLVQPYSMARHLVLGGRVLREFAKPGTFAGRVGQAAEYLERSGATMKPGAEYTNRMAEKFLDAIHQHQVGTSIVTAPLALLEKLAAPIMQFMVPRMKAGAFYDLSRFEVSRLKPEATELEVNAAIQKARNSIDNRFGQLAYDNLFWPKTVQHTLMAGVRSVGWNYGTVGELGGGAVDLVHGRLTSHAAYTFMLPVVVGVYGAVVGYLYTGRAPRDLKDLYYIPTGKRDPDGNEERVTLPNYFSKDVLSLVRHPVTTVMHKLHPMIGTIADMLMNRDFYGNQIQNMEDSPVQRALQLAEHALKQLVPISVRNIQQQRQQTQTPVTQAAAYMGVTPASREAVRSPAQNLMAELLANRGRPALTPEQEVASERRHNIARGVRAGTIGIRGLIDSVQAGALSDRSAGGMARRRTEPPIVTRFKQLTWEEAERVYREGNPQEREQWWPSLWHKRTNAWGQLQATGVMTEQVKGLQALLNGPPGQPAPRQLTEPGR